MKSLLETFLAHPEFPSAAWRRLQLGPGRVVVRAGEAGRALYLVEAGRLRVSGRVRLDGQRRVRPGFCDLEPGEVFGELALFGDGPRTATVVTVTEARVVEFDGILLGRFLDDHPELGYRFLRALHRTLAARLGRADRQLEELLAWGLRVRGIDAHL